MAEENSVARKTLEDRNRASDLERVRHSCAHVMAAAVMRIWPNAQLDIGPSTNEGFYYDFDLPDHRFTPEEISITSPRTLKYPGFMSKLLR